MSFSRLDEECVSLGRKQGIYVFLSSAAGRLEFRQHVPISELGSFRPQEVSTFLSAARTLQNYVHDGWISSVRNAVQINVTVERLEYDVTQTQGTTVFTVLAGKGKHNEIRNSWMEG